MAAETGKHKGEDEAFLRELFEECKPMIVWTARKTVKGSDTAVEEVLQETMVRLTRNVSKLRSLERKARYAYISHTVRNAGLNYIHDQDQDRHLFDQTEDFEEVTRVVRDTMPLPEEAAEQEEYIASRWKAFRQLPAQERHIMIQKYFLEVSDQELAGQLGCKPASVRMVVTRIRKKLHAIVEKGDGDES